jgi:hypothetical protein
MSNKMGRRGLFGALAGAACVALGVGCSGLHHAARRFMRNNKDAKAYALAGIERRFVQHQARINEALRLRANGSTIEIGADGSIRLTSKSGKASASPDGIIWTERRA